MRMDAVRLALASCALWLLASSIATSQVPVPLLTSDGHPVTWWVVFKFNAKTFRDCGGDSLHCPFGGTVTKYPNPIGEQFVFASSDNAIFKKGTGCSGQTSADPLGATFGEIYNGGFHYVVWNDAFYDDPKIAGGSTWGHSKGMLAWNDSGAGVVLQVTTPSWPGAGSPLHHRKSGNTLGCVTTNNNLLVSQHFFALTLTRDDLVKVLQAMINASVITNPGTPQIVNNGGPDTIQAWVRKLGKKSDSHAILMTTLSSGVRLISKPSNLNVPPWQMVSAELGGVPLRVATWWREPKIRTTKASSKVGCWNPQLPNKRGAVEIATTGAWREDSLGLMGISSPGGNHAKIGVSTNDSNFVIFGDMNQQGALSPDDVPKGCKSSQNGRGGLFYVVKDSTLAQSVLTLISPPKRRHQ